jgi:hypothetical protein
MRLLDAGHEYCSQQDNAVARRAFEAMTNMKKIGVAAMESTINAAGSAR